MAYLIYGKRLREMNGQGPDARYAALNSEGVRVSSLKQAMSYATKEDAQAIIDKYGLDGCQFEIRKAK